MQIDDYKMPTYPVVGFLASHGKRLAIAVALIPVVLGAWMSTGGLGWWLFIAGIPAGLLLGVVLFSYVEVLQIIADTLMPK